MELEQLWLKTCAVFRADVSEDVADTWLSQLTAVGVSGDQLVLTGSDRTRSWIDLRYRRVLCECARVVKPGGQIILVNHLYSERGMVAAFERLVAKKAHTLGLRPEFPFARLAAWAQNHGGAEVIERRKIKPFGVYTLVRFRRSEAQAAAA